MGTRVAGVFDATLSESISKSKILVVGAGGIGCEILKNLVLTGFPDIEIVSTILIPYKVVPIFRYIMYLPMFLLQIDLDTIDVSNLNRQFLFHKEHVGKSKADVARDSALTFNPDVKITAHYDTVIRLVSTTISLCISNKEGKAWEKQQVADIMQDKAAL